MGKGSKRRPCLVSEEEMDKNWKLAFSKKKRRDFWDEIKEQRPDLWESDENENASDRHRNRTS